jgi:50S ribosomal protein L16 3-hydroxylase
MQRSQESVIVDATWSEFVNLYWPHVPCVIRSVPDIILAETALNSYARFEKEVENQKATCKIWAVGDNGEHIQKRSGSSSAGKFIESGCSAMWDNIHLDDDYAIRSSIAGELDYTFHSTTSNFLQTPKGGVITTHFDCMEVLVLQVIGCKRWYVSRNQDLHCPTFGYLDRFGTMVMQTESLNWPLRKPELASMQSFMLLPGNILFLPRGFWHSTVALQRSLSVTISFVTATSSDLGIVPQSSLQARCVPSKAGLGCPLCYELADSVHT